jgi:hypothetical protein
MRTGASRRLLILLATVVAISTAAADDWLELQTARFSVVSELSERDTRRWAEEFGRFVESLRQLLPLNENLLPPLTAVLFRRAGGFAPYRLQTESGLVGDTAGVFINYPTWSVIGMPSAGGASADQATTFHEAVHWFMSADPTRYPLWFSEGIAEVFSTFDTSGGYASWGRPIGSHLNFLGATGLQPMGEFLEVTQDEAMHANATYYSQAWLFMHYLLFGRPGDGPALLGQFLRNSREMPPGDAFLKTFDMDFDEMDRLLRSYIRRDSFNVGRAPVADSDDRIILRPASAATVEISLARLAFGTGNDELAEQHLQRLIELVPDSAEAYDLMAARELRFDTGSMEPLLDEAIARRSRDARTYELKAATRIRAERNDEPLFSTLAFSPVAAREIAQYLVQSANLRPLNLGAYQLLADTLFSVDEALATDAATLELGAVVYPREGIILIGQAALALANDDREEAFRLVDRALTGDYELSAAERAAARNLRRRLRI